ncbi:large conductance mechanosensitive channel protein MscL [Candidatus Izemoplasma sp. B36]|uniref:large conductance mechanosensitive channel protein MscL n=1 Tax=Candidatus Izemoplasma sp. B36 TaxID=3242468 RepID=UPI003555D705
MKKFFKEFQEFINKGNALDLAVGLIIGTAFNAIVKSLVNDILMPLLGLVVNADISKLYFVLRGTATYDAVTGSLVLSENAVLMYYGNFLQTIVNFLLIALSIFVAIKAVNKLQNKINQAKELIFDEEEETKGVE